jgi:flagellar motor switch protein FliM
MRQKMNTASFGANRMRGVGDLRCHTERADELPSLPAGCVQRLQAMHETLAGNLTQALSALMKIRVDVALRGISQQTFGHLVEFSEPPACFYVLKADVFEQRPILDIQPAILHPMIDRLLGGTVAAEPLPERPLTEIEWCLAARVVRAFLRECETTWQPVLNWKLEVLEVESDPRSLRVALPTEPMIAIDFDVMMSGLQGRMRFALPCSAFDAIAECMPPNESPLYARPMPRGMATIEVTLAKTQIDAADLADLRVGDIIATETPVGSSAVVSVEGEGEFSAKTGSFQGRKAVRLTESRSETDSSTDMPQE